MHKPFHDATIILFSTLNINTNLNLNTLRKKKEDNYKNLNISRAN